MSYFHLIFRPLLAHAFGVRYELPLPLWLFVIGGAVIVLVSFLMVLPQKITKKQGKTTDQTHLTPFKATPYYIGLVTFLALVVCGLLGSQTVPENILPTLFWLVTWIAVPLSCGLIGDWTQAINVFAGFAKLTDNPRLRQTVLGRSQPLAWPNAVGWWVAALLYLALAMGELIFNQFATLPAVIGGSMFIYFVASGILGMLFGKAWLQKGEVFTVLFSTWGRLGYWRFGAPGRRGFGGGLSVGFEPSVSRITFTLLLLASVTFDGLLSTPIWNRIDVSASTAGFSLADSRLLAVAAFIILIGLFWAVFATFAAAVRSVAGNATASVKAILAGLLPSLLPISFGYLFAHNFEYLVINGQLLFPLIGNPTGDDNWPLHLAYPFNDSFEPKIHLLPPASYWYIAVAVIIAVHIAALIIAHQYLGLATRDERKAKRSELPWLVAMVAYTMVSLWLLAQPLVKEKSGAAGLAPNVIVHQQVL